MRESAKKAMDVQEAALKAVADDAFHGAIDGKTRELAILPRVCWLVVRGTAVRVKVNALLCLSKTFHFLMVRAVVDKVSCFPCCLSCHRNLCFAMYSREKCWRCFLSLGPKIAAAD